MQSFRRNSRSRRSSRVSCDAASAEFLYYLRLELTGMSTGLGTYLAEIPDERSSISNRDCDVLSDQGHFSSISEGDAVMGSECVQLLPCKYSPASPDRSKKHERVKRYERTTKILPFSEVSSKAELAESDLNMSISELHSETSGGQLWHDGAERSPTEATQLFAARRESISC